MLSFLNIQRFWKKVPLWRNAKHSCRMPLASSLKYKNTNLNHLRFLVHNKKRYVENLKLQIAKLKTTSIKVVVPPGNVFVVGSKDEKCGNSICQWDGDVIKFRVPYCLEKQFGEYVSTKLGNFERGINRLPEGGAKTWHFYQKHGKWNVCVQFTPVPIPQKTNRPDWGVIGFDLNPGSIDWCELDYDGNLVRHGKISLQQGLPKGKMQASLTDAALFLVKLSLETKKPVVHERLDFAQKKRSMKEAGTKYNRMLSGWAYARFFELLHAIATNRGVKCYEVASEYTSLIGMVKYMRIYGISSGVAAAIAIGRRVMRLSERLPRSIKTALSLRDRAHLWRGYSKLNKLLKANSGYIVRHSLFCNRSYPNWTCEVKPTIEYCVERNSTE